MNEKIKKIEIREDGFVEVHLKRLKDFDDYLYQQLLQDPRCLPCVRDPKSRTKLYFDTKGCFPLRSYLQKHRFKKMELLDFLIYLLEHVVKLNAEKPFSCSLDDVFLSCQKEGVCFLVLPIVMEYWSLDRSVCDAFLKELLEAVMTEDGYEILGCLLCVLKEKELSFAFLLQRLHMLKQQNTHKKPWYQRLFEKREEAHPLYELPELPRYPNEVSIQQLAEQEKEYEVRINQTKQSAQTVLLFEEEEEKKLFFQHCESGQQYLLKEGTTSIGRSPDNEICLSHLSVSSYHATFEQTSCVLKDLHSLNGTYVNEQRIQEQTLKDGDVVRFGKESLQFLRKY